MDSTNHLDDLHLQGLGADSTHAEINFQIYSELKKVWSKIQELDEDERRLFMYVKQCAVDRTILYLGRLYDRKSTNYPTRCIDEIIDFIERENVEIYTNRIAEMNWERFIVKYDKLLVDIYGKEKPRIDNFLPTVRSYIKISSKESGNKFNRMKAWRDKLLAHNERYKETVFLEDHEVESLINISNSLIDYLNDFVSNEMIAIRRSGQTYFIKEMIKKYCG